MTTHSNSLGILRGLLLFGAVLCIFSEPLFSQEKRVYIGLDSQWPAVLEALPEILRYDDYNIPRFHPLILLPDLTPYPLDMEVFIRNKKLVSRAEGRSRDSLPALQKSVDDLIQKIYLPSLCQGVELVQAQGLEHVTLTLESQAVTSGFLMDHPKGGEWRLRFRTHKNTPTEAKVKLRFMVRGWDLAVLEKFVSEYKAQSLVFIHPLPQEMEGYLKERFNLLPYDPKSIEPRSKAYVSTSYPSALVGAHCAGMDNALHVTHQGSMGEFKKKLALLKDGHLILLHDPNDTKAKGLTQALKGLPNVKKITTLSHLEAEKELCDRHYLGDAVVANPNDLDFPTISSYPRSSLTAPLYAIFRRTGIIFVSGGDLTKYESTRLFQNITFGVMGCQYGFQWEDVDKTRKEIIDGVNRLGIGNPFEPYLTLLGGGHNIPCTFFIHGAWPKSQFPKIRFDSDAVIYADASIYPNLDDDHLMDAAVGRIMGNTDEISAYLNRLIFRREVEDVKKHQANKALLVFGPWGKQGFEESKTKELTEKCGFHCTSFSGSTWGRDFLDHIHEARILFANDFGYHNGAWGWSSYAHDGYQGAEANYNTQTFTLEFDAGYCVATSNGCATCDDKNRDNLHYGGNSLPLGLLFFRNRAMGFFGMPNASLAEITTPILSISKGESLGEAIQSHVNDRLKNPDQGGLFGGRQGWLKEIPEYDSLHQTHPVLFPMTKQDGLVLFGDPQARLARPLDHTYLEMARGAADHLVATANKNEHGWDLTREEKTESAYGQSGAGAALFLIHLYKATGEKKYLSYAQKEALWILHATQSDEDRIPGLFVGDSGKGVLFLELYKTTKDKVYLDEAVKLVRHFSSKWRYKKNSQPYWFTDLYLGAAGHLLFVLAMYEELQDPLCKKEAIRAAEFLLKWAEPVGRGGFQWKMAPWDHKDTAYYTGLAHGAAGIAYALAEAHRVLGESKYLKYAEGGMKWVMNIAIPMGKGYKWYAKYSPEPAKIKYQWCHGPPGMLQAFLKMYEVTNKKIYRTWAEKTAFSAAKPGKYYRYDMGLCHGPPGNGDIFLEAYRILKDKKYLEVARDHGELARVFSIKTEHGIDWRHANRSYMNGVAGVGHFFLRLATEGQAPPALGAK